MPRYRVRKREYPLFYPGEIVMVGAVVDAGWKVITNGPEKDLYMVEGVSSKRIMPVHASSMTRVVVRHPR